MGLVTGNRRENPDARVLVVVAEILLNRLLHGTRDAGREAGDGERRKAEGGRRKKRSLKFILHPSSFILPLIPNP